MVRGKIQMRRIENAANRQVTFSKRRNGLLKKARELSVLCDVEVAVIIFSQKGKRYEFSSTEMKKIIERYRKQAKDHEQISNQTEADQQYMQHLRLETAKMAKKIELLEVSRRKLLGRDISSCSYEELQGIDRQLEHSLRNIRARKDQLFNEQIWQLKTKEEIILAENAKLREKSTGINLPHWQPSIQEKEGVTNYSQSTQKKEGVTNYSQSSQSTTSDEQVETELFIGPPRSSLLIPQAGCS